MVSAFPFEPTVAAGHAERSGWLIRYVVTHADRAAANQMKREP